MFVDEVSSGYDLDFQVLEDVTSKWNHHEVKCLEEGLECRKILEAVPRKGSNSLNHRDVTPKMVRISVSYEKDGLKGEASAEYDFTGGNNSSDKSETADNSSSSDNNTNDVSPENDESEES